MTGDLVLGADAKSRLRTSPGRARGWNHRGRRRAIGTSSAGGAAVRTRWVEDVVGAVTPDGAQRRRQARARVAVAGHGSKAERAPLLAPRRRAGNRRPGRDIAGGAGRA